MGCIRSCSVFVLFFSFFHFCFLLGGLVWTYWLRAFHKEPLLLQQLFCVRFFFFFHQLLCQSKVLEQRNARWNHSCMWKASILSFAVAVMEICSPDKAALTHVFSCFLLMETGFYSKNIQFRLQWETPCWSFQFSYKIIKFTLTVRCSDTPTSVLNVFHCSWHGCPREDGKTVIGPLAANDLLIRVSELP